MAFFHFTGAGFLILHLLCIYSLFNLYQSAFWVAVTLYVFTGILGITVISDLTIGVSNFRSTSFSCLLILNSMQYRLIHLYSAGDGDGWPNNNHHAILECLKWWKINVTWYMVRLLEYVGLATNGGNDMNKARKWHLKNSVSRTVLLLSVHGLCLFAPSNFNWTAIWVMMIIGVITTLFGINLSYHRNLSHRSFKLPKYLEYLFAYFGLLALQGDPIYWVSTHRYHHKFTDTDKDPHSPIQGFWFSHISWLFNYNKLLHEGGYSKNVADLKKQFYYRFLQKTLVFHILLLPVLLYKFGGFPFIVWGMGMRTMITYHSTFMVNSICHIWGHQAWNTGDLSKNNWFVGLIAFGEGWHNNHHAFEFSARHGLEWWQIDMTWYIIHLLEHVGLATNVKLPSDTLKQKMSFKNEKNEQGKC